MGLTLYGPDEVWPEHDKPFWQTALKKARASGWNLEYLGAPHTYGFVKCPAGEHTAKADCTAKAGESYAKDLEKAVRDCRHGTSAEAGSKVAERLESAETLLATAERLVARAENDLVLAEARIVAFLHLDRLALLLDTAAANLDAAAALADDAADGGRPEPGVRESLEAEQEEALERAVALEAAPSPTDVATSLDRARDAADEAADVVTRIRRPGLAKPLQARTERVQIQIDRLRERLDRLEEDIRAEND